MKIDFSSLKLKREFDRIKLLNWIHCCLACMGLFLEMAHGFIGGNGIFKLIILLFVYRLYFRVIHNLYYSYWTFSVCLMLYFGFGFFQGVFIFKTSILSYNYLLSMLFLFVEMYTLSSPIYYPMVKWWIYDFRYRNDVKIIVHHGSDHRKEKKINGRLTDVRRGAGCITLFENYRIGDFLFILLSTDYRDLDFKVELISKRETLMGRGITYGVKFAFRSSEEKEAFNRFVYNWQEEDLQKRRSRFKVVKKEDDKAK